MTLNLSLKLHISDVADAWRAARLQPFFKLSHECHVKDIGSRLLARERKLLKLKKYLFGYLKKPFVCNFTSIWLDSYCPHITPLFGAIFITWHLP